MRVNPDFPFLDIIVIYLIEQVFEPLRSVIGRLIRSWSNPIQ
jgi:hypothetical protein